MHKCLQVPYAAMLIQTRMHSSRMRTARVLSVSRSARGGGGLPGGGSAGVSGWRGICMGGGCLPGGLSVQRHVHTPSCGQNS